MQNKYIVVSTISIHAPAKGATHFLGQQSVEKIDFNPRSREGSDVVDPLVICYFVHFNPRSREGSDCIRTNEFR